MPPESSSASIDAPPACRKAYAALLGKVVDDETRAHLTGCGECAVLEGLLMGSRVSGSGSEERSPLGRLRRGRFDPEFERMLAGLVGSGEPILGKYRVEERVAGGGQGVVFRAVDTDIGQTVAIKAVACDPSDPSSGIEDLHGRNVHHTNIVAVYTAERHAGLRLIVMEFIGETLAGAKDKLSDEQKLAVFGKICDGVAAAHDADILHLDLKPSNVLLRASREPAVTDFGLSVRVQGGEAARAPGYTETYAAPEQLDGRPVSKRTDVFALGRILATLFPSAPRPIRRAIARATANDPEHRYADARKLAAAVDLAAVRRRRRVRLAAAVGIATVLVAAAWFVVPPPKGRRVAWHGALWGPDLVPRLARNVAVGLPPAGMVADSPSFPCARSVAELHDGIAHYRDMCHGYVFYGPKPVCVPDEWFRDYPPPPEGAADCPDGSGRKLVPANDCDKPEGDGVVVTLDRPQRIVAVRPWFHQGVPIRLSVQVDDGKGGWSTVAAPKQVPEAFWELKQPLYHAGGAMSATILLESPGVVTRRLRLVTWCDPEEPSGTRGQPVWLNEIEVFAAQSRAEAWKHWLLGD